MAGLVNKFVVGASVLVGMSAVVAAPAQAQFEFESIGGAEDFILYGVNGNETTEVTLEELEENQTENQTEPEIDPISKLLQGDSSNPTGNVELFGSSESVSSAQYVFGPQEVTSIEGTYKGQDLTISSLTAMDWFINSSTGVGSLEYGADNFANTYFNAFFDAAIQDTFKGLVSAELGKDSLYYWFLEVGFFQAASDPNISYITDNGQDLQIGLAGHFNLTEQYGEMLGIDTFFLNNGIQFSEAVKVNYGGVEQLLFGTVATASGLVSDDGTNSHNGNYEVTLSGVIEPPASVPEPSTMLGLMAVGGLFAAAKRNSKKA